MDQELSGMERRTPDALGGQPAGASAAANSERTSWLPSQKCEIATSVIRV